MFAAPLSLILAACDLSGSFADRAGWEKPAEAFVAEHREDGFRFADARKNIANCLRRGGCTWQGLEVWEARVYYSDAGAARVEMSLYNRGDDRSGAPMAAADLKALLDRIAARAEPGGKIGPNPEKRKLPSGGYQFQKRFAKGENDIELVWGVDSVKLKDQTADYVRVTMLPKGAGPKSARPSPGGVSKTKARSNVAKNDAGDVWIDNVPMVDQGQKGYCAAAVAERVLRYYGHDIDEHQIAQMAGTTARGGTSVAEMLETVKAVGSRCRLGFQPVVSLAGSLGEIEKDVAAYNKVAKQMGRPAIALDACMEGDTIMVARIADGMEPEVLLKTRMRDSRFKRFLAGVKKSVDQGIPVFWGVTLGKFPEPDIPQADGGHMRLVIGYNARTHEILYTDTWGAGHELKRMDEGRAFAITHDAFFLKPL